MATSIRHGAPERAPADPLRGTRYRSLRGLGRGGMGEVVLAEHLGLGKHVVVKLLHEQFAKDAGVAKRMQIEARSLAALESPHIVQVTDFGQTATGRTYIVMERLVGRTLGAELRARGPLPVSEAIAYVVQVLAGLEAAHVMGIIHRDIKPDNIFLCDATRDVPRMVKVLDFGVAKILDVATEVGRPAIPRLLTEEGAVVGTPRVVPPEQACGRPVDARTDVYATGMLLYTLIAGRGPFAHLTDTVELLKANVMERPEPPSHKAKQRIPAALDAAVLRALEKQPEDRFPSAEAFAMELRRIAAALTTAPSGASEPTGPQPATSVAVPSGPRPAEYDDGAPTLRIQDAALTASGAGSNESAPRAVIAPSEGPRHRTEVRTFVALTLISAAISAILIFVLQRVAP